MFRNLLCRTSRILLSLLLCCQGIFADDRSSESQIQKELVCCISTGDDNPRNSEGDFIRLKNGDILYIFTHYYGKSGDDNATAYLASRRSSDNGKTWTKEDKVEIENEGAWNIMSVSLRRFPDGKIGLFYLVKEEGEDCRPYLRCSENEGESWGERTRIIDTVTYNVVNNDRILILPNGRILVPIAQHYRDPQTGHIRFDKTADLFCAYSDDGGKTWKEGERAPTLENVIYQEPGICEIADGRLLMFIRTNMGCQYYAYSSDNGISWSQPEPSPLDSPMSPALIKRLPNNDGLIAIWNPVLDKEAKDLAGERGGICVGILSPDGSRILKRKVLEYPRAEDTLSHRAWQYPALLNIGEKEYLTAYFSWLDGIFIYRFSLP